eukprot:scaffold157515_cov15-Prasinocladus_malaysianus.AAC.1
MAEAAWKLELQLKERRYMHNKGKRTMGHLISALTTNRNQSYTYELGILYWPIVVSPVERLAGTKQVCRGRASSTDTTG